MIVTIRDEMDENPAVLRNVWTPKATFDVLGFSGTEDSGLELIRISLVSTY